MKNKRNKLDKLPSRSVKSKFLGGSTEPLKNNSTADRVLSMLIAAEGKPLTRTFLSSKTNLSDRQVREQIAKLRDRGYIIGLAPGGGYTFNNIEDLELAIKKEEARCRTLHKRIKKMKKAIEHKSQVMLDV